MEYTLEDALETLKDIETEREEEIEQLLTDTLNNGPVTLNASCNPEDVRKKQHKLCISLANQIREEIPKDYPIPNTSDLHFEVLKELEEEVRTVEQLLDKTETYLSEIEDDISFLKSKKEGLKKMKETYLDATELTNNTNYDKELHLLKRIFYSTKNDLYLVVQKLFPNNRNFEKFLEDLTCAYTKGGDDLYVNITPQHLVFVHFLIEADIVMYHRNDKSKVRLMDML
ncbi:hypothetical protein WH47_11145 [Habropoda laboriosa]|uniref:Centromere protein K n=1 Tax=Habropoda laboriosa TaxID=597456 RepID=A0A0L7RA77_9HYME|nr:PREDICTED: uncharacterized protein LOC108570198 [Habropoda laboriosa]KOC67744.1 hypothetical protein WH47_11145 [Habropoda laboriosa]